MAKKSMLEMLINTAMWIVGLIISLAVGTALINETLSVPYIGILNVIAGWIVVILTIVGAILALLKK